MMNYFYPSSLEEAVQVLAKHEGRARVIAGGTDVMPDIREGKIAPRLLVDVTRIPELNLVNIAETFITVGAAVTFTEIQEHPYFRQRLHAFIDAA